MINSFLIASSLREKTPHEPFAPVPMPGPWLWLVLLSCGADCRDDAGEMAANHVTETGRPAKRVAAGHLGETVSLLGRIHRLNEEKARQKDQSTTSTNWCERTRIGDAAAGKSDCRARRSALPRIVESIQRNGSGDAIAGRDRASGISRRRRSLLRGRQHVSATSTAFDRHAACVPEPVVEQLV